MRIYERKNCGGAATIAENATRFTRAACGTIEVNDTMSERVSAAECSRSNVRARDMRATCEVERQHACVAVRVQLTELQLHGVECSREFSANATENTQRAVASGHTCAQSR